MTDGLMGNEKALTAMALIRKRVVLGLLAGVFLLGGCSSARTALITSKTPPDEFAVYSRAPLTLPPDYALRPPQPGETRPDGVDPQREAKNALFGTANGTGGTSEMSQAAISPGLRQLFHETGADKANPLIRQEVNNETATLAERDRTWAEKIIFWGKPEPFGTVVDAAKEEKRLRENAGLGKPVTNGKTPSIERKPKALLEGIFN